jgi:hypothetical protein
MKFLILTLVSLLLIGCKKEIDVKLTIDETDQFKIITSDAERLTLPKGKLNGLLVVDARRPEKSYLQLNLIRENKPFRPKVPIRLPELDNLLGSNEPIRLESKLSGQKFDMMVVREMRPENDLFTISFYRPGFNFSFAEMTFEFEPSKVYFDQDKNEFLLSYQKVKRKQRAIVVKIDGEVDSMIASASRTNWFNKTLNHITNYGGASLIAPWVNARYKEVKWIIGKHSKASEIKIWKDVAKDYPVIDYFAFVHAKNQYFPEIENDEKINLKKNQLRTVYTGACSSGYGSEWILNQGAVAAAGQKSTSASALFQFTVLRKWIYGFNLEDALVNSYQAGVRKARALEWISFAQYWEEKHGVMYWKDVDDMLASSEILFSYTPEVPAKNILIDQSVIITKTYNNEDIIKKGAIEVLAERNGEMILDYEDYKADREGVEVRKYLETLEEDLKLLGKK